jgi:hypothetical protein
MYEIREYDNGSFSLVFDMDFEFNVFRYYIEEKCFPYEVYLIEKGKELFVGIGKADVNTKEVSLIDDFSKKRFEKHCLDKLGFCLKFQEDGSIHIDDYQLFTQYLILYFYNGIQCEWDEEEVVLENGTVEIQNIVHCLEIPRQLIEVMAIFYEH